MAGQNQATAAPNMDQFEAYFRRADLDQDGKISGAEAVSFFQGANLPKQVLAQIWMHADTSRTGFLGRLEFYNALKLVTVAQSKRELTPEIVKAALYGPASSKIPPPQINVSAIQAPQSNLMASTPAPQLSATSQSTGIRGARGLPQQSQIMNPPRPPLPSIFFDSQQGTVTQMMPTTGITASSPPPSSNASSDLFGGRMGSTSSGVASQIPGTLVASQPPSSKTSPDLHGGRMGGPQVAVQAPNRGISSTMGQDGFGRATPGMTSMQSRPHATVGLMQPVIPKPNDATSISNQAVTGDTKAFSASGNGFVSNSVSPDALGTIPSQHNHNLLTVTSSSTSTSISSATGPQPTIWTNVTASSQNLHPQQPTGNHHQQVHSMKQDQGFKPPASIPSSQSQLPWPRMTQSEFQKYRKVFLQVDTDRDGKITGEQARNLFLSWRLPREILKQVWDLSDQDNDSMLSLREFCIALYLMERNREGCPLPSTLPANIMFDEMLAPASNQPPASYNNANWRPPAGLQQVQGLQQVPGVRPVYNAGRGKPPRPVPIPDPDETILPKQQRPKVPVLEKHLLDQLSTEEQNSLHSRFQEAIKAEKMVDELEKEILDSRQKIEFYRAKMQELVLYKSRCDNRLNEITERVSSDKQEVESLAKKYEEKYKQIGDVASKLTIEEATFRDIQEDKMELYRAIVKFEQEGNDGIQARADKIQSKLEEMVKALNERCKNYGLRAKPVSLVELPFGWQPGIQGAAADWDEAWDKFEDEGLIFVKELTLDVQNVIAPRRPKSSLVPEKTVLNEAVTEVTTSDADDKSEVSQFKDDVQEEGLMKTKDENIIRSSPKSPAGRDSSESPSKRFQDSQARNMGGDGSPHDTETRSELGAAESMFSGDRSFDEPSWGRFDTQFDTDAGWDVNSVSSKDLGHEISYFDSDNWGLNPIKTGPSRTENVFQKGFAFDSVPSTPLFDSGSTPHADNLFQKKSPFAFADSVPSTPHVDNIFQKKSQYAFADSVPSTPMYSNSPRRYGEVSDERSFDSFSRFDSLSMHDGGSFQPSLSRFDSMRSTRDVGDDHDYFQSHDSFGKFDSMHSSGDFEYDHGSFQPRESFSRFDSMRSTRDTENDHGFFQSEYDSTHSTRDFDYDHGFSQSHEPFSRFDSFRSTSYSDKDHAPYYSHESFSRVDSIRSTRDSDYSRTFPSFDDSDPFGPSDPFPKSLESQTPRRDADNWRAF